MQTVEKLDRRKASQKDCFTGKSSKEKGGRSRCTPCGIGHVGNTFEIFNHMICGECLVQGYEYIERRHYTNCTVFAG